MTSKRPRIAVVSTSVPPAVSGQARVLGHLLGSPAEPNCLVLTDQFPFPPGTQLCDFPNYAMLDPVALGLEPKGRFQALPSWMRFAVPVGRAVLRRAAEIRKRAADFKAQVLVGCTASPFDLPATALAAVWLRLPFVAYLFDDPIYQWAPGPLRNVARFHEALWSRKAARVITPNEAMQREFEMRRPGRSLLVRNPVSPAALEPPEIRAPERNRSGRIVYTGSVYHAQADAFVNMTAALSSCAGWSLHIYTQQSDAELARYGITGSNVFRHEPVPLDQSHEVQREADLLFLPLAFHSTIQDVIRTSAPGKLAEYLASGRPILAHAPGNTFVVEHLRAHDAALIVDKPEPAALVQVLESIGKDSAMTRGLTQNARRLAKEYSAEKAREIFWEAMVRLVE